MHLGKININCTRNNQFLVPFMGLLATESACTFLDVKADRDCKTQIFLGNSPGYHLIDLINLIDCVILPMSLQGLFGCRKFMLSIDTAWQVTLCFAHGCFPNLGFHFYFTQSPNANSISGLTLFKLTSNI